MNSKTALRVNAFEQIQSEALQVLKSSEAEEVLGEQAVELAGCIQKSYVAQEVFGNIVVPLGKRQTEDIAVHPVVDDDNERLTYTITDWISAKDKRRLGGREVIGHKHERDIDGLTMSRTIRKVVTLDNSDIVLGLRPFIVYPRNFGRMFTPYVRAAITAHEYDHCLHYCEVNNLDDTLIANGNTPELIAELEKSAYQVTASILSLFAAPVMHVKSIRDYIQAPDAASAGKQLKDLVFDTNKNIFKTRAERLHVLALGIGVISTEYGESGVVTPNELIALKATGIIASRKSDREKDVEQLSLR